MNNDENLFYNFIINTIANKNIIEETEIDNTINQLKGLPMFSCLDENDILNVKNKIVSQMDIRLREGALIEDTKHEKWFLTRKSELSMAYWNRYRQYLLLDKQFQPQVVNTMDDILDKLTDLLGDPTKSKLSRKGLVLGDVQSGKTANYTGLICKAADAGYKVIVLLTGTIENLRKQTQMRLDEGFVGQDSAALSKKIISNRIGSGKYDPSIYPMVLTSTIDDFKTKGSANMNFNLRTVNEPVLFVVKKNVTVLKRLNAWLRTFNINSDNKIDTSILVVDDEADNASVNTNPEDKDSTAINNQITDLIDVFNKSSYVGFTATPYANIFIDPDTNDDMEKEDLFPKDYIYALNAPDNYIGARDIFGEEGIHKSMCIQFNQEEEEELERLIPLKHKNGFYIKSLPTSMKEAIGAFLVANAIRDIRGDIKAHRSMLINVSRFNDVQKQFYDEVNLFVKDIKSSLNVNSKLDIKQARMDKNIRFLEDMYNKYYEDTGVTWNKVLSILKKSITPIELVMVNQKSEKGLDYDMYPDGMRVIAIGGLSLSRGLTLEGLMSSYFYRNSRMYDTLMQMGRWFGYRKNYEDLCKIWMSSTSYEWYKHISEATDDLRHDIVRYQDSDLTPLDFGLRVRSDINTLLVTARNKMRTAGTEVCTISLSEECIETTDLFIDQEITTKNLQSVERLKEKINHISKDRIYKQGNAVVFKDIDKKLIVDLLEEIQIPISNEKLDPEVLIDLIQNYRGTELNSWDIVFASGSHDRNMYKVSEDYSIKLRERSFSFIDSNNSIIRVGGSKRRLGNVGDGAYGLDIADKDILNRIRSNKYENRKKLRQNDYFKYRYILKERNPQLIIYNIILTKNKDEKNSNLSDTNNIRGVGFGIGIPKLLDQETKYAKYTINKVAQTLKSEYDIGDDE